MCVVVCVWICVSVIFAHWIALHPLHPVPLHFLVEYQVRDAGQTVAALHAAPLSSPHHMKNMRLTSRATITELKCNWDTSCFRETLPSLYSTLWTSALQCVVTLAWVLMALMACLNKKQSVEWPVTFDLTLSEHHSARYLCSVQHSGHYLRQNAMSISS